jgi:hypothetical protein
MPTVSSHLSKIVRAVENNYDPTCFQQLSPSVFLSSSKQTYWQNNSILHEIFMTAFDSLLAISFLQVLSAFIK